MRTAPASITAALRRMDSRLGIVWDATLPWPCWRFTWEGRPQGELYHEPDGELMQGDLCLTELQELHARYFGKVKTSAEFAAQGRALRRAAEQHREAVKAKALDDMFGPKQFEKDMRAPPVISVEKYKEPVLT